MALSQKLCESSAFAILDQQKNLEVTELIFISGLLCVGVYDSHQPN